MNKNANVSRAILQKFSRPDCEYVSSQNENLRCSWIPPSLIPHQPRDYVLQRAGRKPDWDPRMHFRGECPPHIIVIINYIPY